MSHDMSKDAVICIESTLKSGFQDADLNYFVFPAGDYAFRAVVGLNLLYYGEGQSNKMVELTLRFKNQINKMKREANQSLRILLQR